MPDDLKCQKLAANVRELLDEAACTSEDSCVILLDVVTDLIVEYAEGDKEKLTACFEQWMDKIIGDGIKKSSKKYPPMMPQ
jgi:hypothetical protein